MLLYTVFHLNLAYSSIEEEQRPEVIQRCYWPLLRLAEELALPFGIEASGYTLEVAADLDPAWVDELRRLTTTGPCEFVGSGYVQLIGPLVPAGVNAANLRLGNLVYEKLLGFRPRVALVNEQAYSAGLVRHYLDAGYRAIIMEWDNAFRYHPEWNPEWRYLPQFACGQYGEEIPVVWSKSIAFQKFQRYVHGEMELEEYLDYLIGHVGETPRAFPLYCSDTEIFDFRPGRYHTEPPLAEEGEWARIHRLLKVLRRGHKRFTFVRPSQVLELLQEAGAGNRLRLESPAQPIPVKKQEKYNVTRWAVTGRDDLGINSACWSIYEALKANPAAGEEEWRELCYLWSSDFRTHITDQRWLAYRKRLEEFLRSVYRPSLTGTPETGHTAVMLPNLPTIRREGRFLVIETNQVRARLNCRRGMTIDSLWLGTLDGPPLCGTLPHGYYDDISLGSDWYTGHVVLEVPGRPKVTDLQPVEPCIQVTGTSVVVEGSVPIPLGSITKVVEVPSGEPRLEITYRLHLDEAPVGSLRLGNVTLNPAAFDRKTLRYRTHNGGSAPETFELSGSHVEHGEAVSFLVSANCAIGMTEGWVELGDSRRVLRLEVDKARAAVIGLVTYREVGETYFCRLALSACELDETRRPEHARPFRLECRLCLKSFSMGGRSG